MLMPPTEGLLVHNVYFRLHDRSAAAREQLLAACRRYLPGHHGVLFFACGTLAESLVRDVNDRDWDVGLHIIFRDLAAHDVYQDSAAHQQFIAENRATWQKVRVFDSVATQTPTP
jgi:hypothetical protein